MRWYPIHPPQKNTYQLISKGSTFEGTLDQFNISSRSVAYQIKMQDQRWSIVDELVSDVDRTWSASAVCQRISGNRIVYSQLTWRISNCIAKRETAAHTLRKFRAKEEQVRRKEEDVAEVTRSLEPAEERSWIEPCSKGEYRVKNSRWVRVRRERKNGFP